MSKREISDCAHVFSLYFIQIINLQTVVILLCQCLAAFTLFNIVYQILVHKRQAELSSARVAFIVKKQIVIAPNSSVSRSVMTADHIRATCLLSQTEAAVFKLWMLYFQRNPLSYHLEITTVVVVPCGSRRTSPRTSI